MRLTITAKSAAGYEVKIEEECASVGVLLDTEREIEQQLAKRGYTPTHPRPYREKLTETERIHQAYSPYLQKG